MSIKTIFLPIIAGDGDRPRSAIDYALAMAAAHGAHLSVAIGAIKVPAVVYSGVADIVAVVADANGKRHAEGEAIAVDLKRACDLNGVSASVEVISDLIDPLFARIGKRARLHDLAVCGRAREADVWSKELAETLLLSSGRPVIVVPDGFAADRTSGTIIIAWDGTAVSARAVGEATPLWERASLVEIVTVSGDKHADDLVPGSELAPMLAHHGLKVQVTELPGNDRHAGQTIMDHASLVRARMVVMGGYAHSRLRQMVLGGTTRTMLEKASIPVFLAH
jgi:nucleotide-binding universal stress UspA family protein